MVSIGLVRPFQKMIPLPSTIKRDHPSQRRVTNPQQAEGRSLIFCPDANKSKA